MTRLSQLPDNSIKTQILGLRHDVDALKTAQVVGSTSVRLKRVSNGLTNGDFTATASYNVINCWEVTYTPTSNGLANTGFLWRVFYNGFNPVGTGSYNTFLEDLGYNGGVWKNRFWLIGTSPSASLTFNVNVVIYAMTTGTISVSQIQ